MNTLTTPTLFLAIQLSLHSLAWLITMATSHLAPENSEYFCEQNMPPNQSTILQPVNTWSNVALFFVSWVATFVGYFFNTAAYNPLYAFLSPIIILHLALASFEYHMILTFNSSIGDIVSIILYLALEVATSLVKVVSTMRTSTIPYLNVILTLSIWTILTIIPTCVVYVGYQDQNEAMQTGINSTVGVYIAISVLLEIAYYIYLETKANRPNKGCCYASRGIWCCYGAVDGVYLGLILLIGIFGTPAGVMWSLRSYDSYPCEDITALWGHGLWHILISGSILSLFILRAYAYMKYPMPQGKQKVEQTPYKEIPQKV